MKKRYIFFAIVSIYLIIVLVVAVFAISENSESEPPATQCEMDRDTVQEALNSYNEANGDWPTADGLPGDIVWSELVPQYMSEMPVIDGDCDWQVSGNPEGSVCVAHTC